jgi:hypothetical protein
MKKKNKKEKLQEALIIAIHQVVVIVHQVLHIVHTDNDLVIDHQNVNYILGIEVKDDDVII